MNVTQFLVKQTKMFGEKRLDCRSIYKPLPGLDPTVRLPDWVRGLIQEAFDAGKEQGSTNAQRRIRRKADKVLFGMPGSAKGTIMTIFE